MDLRTGSTSIQEEKDAAFAEQRRIEREHHSELSKQQTEHADRVKNLEAEIKQVENDREAKLDASRKDKKKRLEDLKAEYEADKRTLISAREADLARYTSAIKDHTDKYEELVKDHDRAAQQERVSDLFALPVAATVWEGVIQVRFQLHGLRHWFGRGIVRVTPDLVIRVLPQFAPTPMEVRALDDPGWNVEMDGFLDPYVNVKLPLADYGASIGANLKHPLTMCAEVVGGLKIEADKSPKIHIPIVRLVLGIGVGDMKPHSGSLT